MLQAHLSKTFVGLILLPIIGNAVEHITAVTVAMKVRQAELARINCIRAVFLFFVRHSGCVIAYILDWRVCLPLFL